MPTAMEEAFKRAKSKPAKSAPDKSATPEPVATPAPPEVMADAGPVAVATKPASPPQRVTQPVGDNFPRVEPRKQELPKAAPVPEQARVTLEIATNARLSLWRQRHNEREFIVAPTTSGELLQTHNGQPNRQAEISVGLDFGTSCTKVVMWDAARSKGFAVPFRDGHGVGSYLAPGRVFTDRNSFRLEHGSEACRDLKLAFLANPGDPDARLRLVAFLALILRRARCWFFREHGDLYEETSIVWTLACGLPARRWGDTPAADALKTCLKAAWGLSCTSGGEVAAERALRVLHGEGDLTDAARDIDVRVIPELFAQIYGFVKSTGFDEKARNFFLLCDVGAGTVDSALFHIQAQRRGQLRFDLFTSEVEQLGVTNLHRHRAAWWINELQCLPGTQHLISALDALTLPTDHELQCPESFREYFFGITALVPDSSPDPDEDFFKRVSYQIRRTYYQAWKQGHLGQHELRDMPFFLCGGGSRMDYFQRIAGAIATEGATWMSILPRTFDVPQDLNAPDIDAHDYDRLSVAYGLARLSLGPLDGPDSMQTQAPNPRF